MTPSRTSVVKLLGKLSLLIVPFIISFLYLSVTVPWLTTIQQARMQDKVQKLLLDATTTPQVIIAGDSRAEDNVVPAIFSAKTGLSAANVAEGDEILSQTYNTLSDNGVLDTHRLIIISVTAYDISDTMLDNQPIDKTVFETEPWGAQKIKDMLAYYKNAADYYIVHYKNVMHFSEGDNIHAPQTLLAAKGFSAQENVLHTSPGQIPSNPDAWWYAKFRPNGVKQADFVHTLEAFGNTNDTVVIYIGPQAPIFKENTLGSNIQAEDKAFAAVIAQTIAPYSNMHFIDFQDQDNPTLSDEDFADRVHLNSNGAPVFTQLLVDTLKQKGIIK
jgi:hypothetical protein